MRRRRSTGLLVIPVALAGVVVPAASASAAPTVTRYVATTGTDTGSCVKAHPCQTVDYAIGKSAAGDTIAIAAGTYHQTVAMTTPVNLTGAGVGKTILSGLGTTPSSTGAEIVIDTTAVAPVAIRALTVNNARRASSTNREAADIANVGAPLALTVSTVLLGGVAAPASTVGFGLITVAGGTVVLEHSTVQGLNAGAFNESGGTLTVTADTFQRLQATTQGSNTEAPVGVAAENGSGNTSTLDVTSDVFSGYAGTGVLALDASGSCSTSCKTDRANIAGNSFTLGGAKTAGGPFPAAAIDLLDLGGNVPLMAAVHNNTGTVTAPTRAQFTVDSGGLLEMSEHNNPIKIR